MITLAKFAAPATAGVHAAALADRFPAGTPAEAVELATAYTVRQFDADWNAYPVNRHGIALVAGMARNNLADMAEFLRDMR